MNISTILNETTKGKKKLYIHIFIVGESEGQNRKQKNRTKTQNLVTDPTKTEREKWIPEMGFVWGIIFGQIRNKKKESCKNLENPKTMGR